METLLDSQQIQEIIPHRHPFLLIDRVVELEEGQRIKALKLVTASEPHFAGHFPENPVMPGVLIIEALAQAGAVAVLKQPQYQGRTAYFAGLDKCRFKRKVVPGDTLELHVEILKMRRNIGKGHAEARVDGELAATAEITFAIDD